MIKNMRVEVDIDTARRMLSLAGYQYTNRMSDEEVFNRALSMNNKYSVKYDDSATLDMRSKVEEYIKELDQEIDRCMLWLEDNMSGPAPVVARMEARAQVLGEVINDLQGRLEELI